MRGAAALVAAGIPPDAAPRIFDRFERAVPAGHFSGLGLGLYISPQIVRDHGGTIEVRETPGGGATFTVTLPLVSRPADPAVEPAGAAVDLRERLWSRLRT